MIELDLVKDAPCIVSFTTTKITVTRVGDIAIFKPRPAGVDGVDLEYRPPWQELCITDGWKVQSGICNEQPHRVMTADLTESEIWISTPKCELGKMKQIYEQNALIALIQQSPAGYRASICNARLSGIRISNKKSTQLAFLSTSCEMVYGL